MILRNFGPAFTTTLRVVSYLDAAYFKLRCGDYQALLKDNTILCLPTGVHLRAENAASVIGWRAISNRLVVVRFSGSVPFSAVSACAPTDQASDEENDAFYAALEGLTRECKKHSALVIISIVCNVCPKLVIQKLASIYK